MELEWRKVSAVHDCPPGYWTFCSENFFLEPAADASDVNSIREGGEYSLDCSYVLGRFWSWN